MYSIVLMAAMTATTEAPGFGDTWAKHCFWESCLPARYGWVSCGPGYNAYYPAAYTSCCGYGGFHHFHHFQHSCHGCYGSCHGYRSCHGCYSSCHGCYGAYWGGANFPGACSGTYYNCYGGGGTNLWSGIGYAGFGAYGNFGNYDTLPFYSAPVYAPPFDARPVEVRPVEVKPVDPKPIIEIKPAKVEPIKVGAAPARAAVVIRVPENAKVYIDENLMHSTSAERTFSTPALEEGQSYFYTLRIVVEKDGKQVEDVRRVSVKAGEVSRLSFDNLFDRVGPPERTVVDSNRNPIK